jgi:uncharacterized repeat protein (TIGR04076 family)
MEGEDMSNNQEMLEGLKQQLGYTDEQWELWQRNPKNLKIAEAFAEGQNYRIVAEVIKSKNCGVGHKEGDKFIFTGDGCFVAKEPPGPVCLSALSPLIPMVNMEAVKSIMGGGDPESVVWDTVHCVDVGVENGGWGEILMRIRVEKI